MFTHLLVLEPPPHCLVNGEHLHGVWFKLNMDTMASNESHSSIAGRGLGVRMLCRPAEIPRPTAMSLLGFVWLRRS
jgi:hypothetical protein